MQDAKALVADIANPLGVEPEYLGIHLGFKEYLYEVLPWHDMMVPALLKQTVMGGVEVMGKVGQGVLDVGTTSVTTVGKGVTTVGTKAYSAAETGAGMVVNTVGSGATAMGTAVGTGVGMVGGAVGKVTDMVGVTENASTRLKETMTFAPSENKEASNTNQQSTDEDKPVTVDDKATVSPPAKEAGVEVSMDGEPKEQPLDSSNPKKNDEEAPKPKQARKYEIIIDQIKQVFADHPDYRLYVGGHSLGGALATVFAFECAAAVADDIPKPVTCITSGAPKVGNIRFLNAFQKLEEDGKIRCLHVANYRDIVTLSPPLPMCCCYGHHFRRVGIHLTLSPHAFALSYPATLPHLLRVLVDIMKWIKHFFFLLMFVPLLALCGCSTKKFLRAEHTQLMYMNRFDNQRERFSDVTIDEIYDMRFSKKSWFKEMFPVIKLGGKQTTMDDTPRTAAQEVDHL